MRSRGNSVAAIILGLVTWGGFSLPAAAEDAKPVQVRLATVKMIMSGIHGPNCGALAGLLKGEGPKDDKGWAEIATHAALLNESGHLLVQNNRCPDGVWAEAASKLRDGTAGLFTAAGKKDLKAAQESFTVVTASCAACHAKHKQPAAKVAAGAAKTQPATGDAKAPAVGAKSGDAAALQPRVAQVRHLMSGINGPACAALGGALKGEGPKEDKGWGEIVKQAALLNEAGFMLMENGRCLDEIWKNACSALRENSGRVAVAGGSKNLEEARVGFKGVTAACGACHAVHKKPPAS